MSKPEHATAGRSMFLLDNSTLSIYGGTKKEILLFTKLVPQADCCDLGDECTINQTDLIIPVPWVKCEGICKRWIHQFCTGLKVMPNSPSAEEVAWLTQGEQTKLI